MLVIKMLKKASNKNNIELAEYLRKTRNTIASWENDENCIPNTEKRKISNRFDFDYSYWDVGLDKTISFYQKMYSDIKNGYLKDLRKQDIECESRIDEILRYCDSTIPYNEDRENTDMKFEIDNEEKHFNYIKSLLNDVDPIDKSKLSYKHFINKYKNLLDDFSKIENKFKKTKQEENNIDKNEEANEYYSLLKLWRKKQAELENVKSFQILSDDVLYSIVLAYLNNSNESIKNFPKNGKKWNKYYDEIINVLKEG